MKNITNKLLIVLAFTSATSQITKADGFFSSVGNVATLGEVNRSKERQAKRDADRQAVKDAEAKKKKQAKKKQAKKSNKKNLKDADAQA